MRLVIPVSISLTKIKNSTCPSTLPWGYASSDWHLLGACLTNAYTLSTSRKPGTNPVLEIASDSQRSHFEQESLMCHLTKRFLEIEVYQIHCFAFIVFLVDLAEKLQEVGQTASTLMETMLRRKYEFMLLQVIYERVADYPFHRLAYNRCQTYRSIIAADLTPTFLVDPLSRWQSSTHLEPPQLLLT